MCQGSATPAPGVPGLQAAQTGRGGLAGRTSLCPAVGLGGGWAAVGDCGRRQREESQAVMVAVGCLLLRCISCQAQPSAPPCGSRVAELVPFTALGVPGCPSDARCVASCLGTTLRGQSLFCLVGTRGDTLVDHGCPGKQRDVWKGPPLQSESSSPSSGAYQLRVLSEAT